jgi:hypothetical protein
MGHGVFTGRSPKVKYVVRAKTEKNVGGPSRKESSETSPLPRGVESPEDSAQNSSAVKNFTLLML